MVSGISIFLYGFFFGWYQCLSGCLSDPTYGPIFGTLIALIGIPILFRINTLTRIALSSIPIAFLSTVSSALYFIFQMPHWPEGVWYYGYPFSFYRIVRGGPAIAPNHGVFMQLTVPQILEDFAFYYVISVSALFLILVINHRLGTTKIPRGIDHPSSGQNSPEIKPSLPP
jgi:hypothetical protein